MNKETFINRVEEKFAKTDNDSLLIEKMREIRNYFSSLQSQIQNIDGYLSVGFDALTADVVGIELFGNTINFKRTDNGISVTFVSNKDNEFTKQYQHLLLDEFVVQDGNLVNKKNQLKFNLDDLDGYLKYLLA